MAKKPPKAKVKPPIFIGLDLAWSDRNPTGAAVIQSDRLIAYTGVLVSDAEILRFVRTHLDAKGPAIITVDAPLRVPNETGSRLCDRALSRDWRQFEAGALPANRRLLGKGGLGRVGADVLPGNGATGDYDEDGEDMAANAGITVRGERLVASLVQRMRFAEAAVIPKRTQDRLVCEVFPHPALVSLFDLEKTLKYKARRGRNYETRWAELARYQALLRSLRRADPPLKHTKELLVRTDVQGLRGKAFKEVEDILDAVTCAYIGAYLWRYGPRRGITYGTLTEGSILVPVTPQMQDRLKRDG